MISLYAIKRKIYRLQFNFFIIFNAKSSVFRSRFLSHHQYVGIHLDCVVHFYQGVFLTPWHFHIIYNM